MTREALFPICAMLLLSGCGQQDKPAKADPPAAAETRAADGTVTIPPDSPKLREIKVTEVKNTEVPIGVVVSPGKIELNPNLVSRVVLPLPGRVVTVDVKLGDAVTRGQTLVTMECPDADGAESAYRQSEAAIVQGRANILKAQLDYDRAQALFQHDAAAKKDVEATENALTQAKTTLQQAEAAREQNVRRLQLLGLKPGVFGQKVVVPAPASGKVLDLAIAPREYRNDTNAPVMTIADLSTVWVAADVAESSIRLIRPGERIDVSLTAYPGETFRARVKRIADTVDPQTRTIKVRAEMDNAHGRFRPEMFGTIRHTEEIRVQPVVPATAVVQGDGKTIVFAERAPGKYQPVELKVGERFGELVPVLAGVKAGDRVVSDGAMLLKAQ